MKTWYFDLFADGFRMPMLTTRDKALRLAKKNSIGRTNAHLDVWNASTMQYETIWKQPNI